MIKVCESKFTGRARLGAAALNGRWEIMHRAQSWGDTGSGNFTGWDLFVTLERARANDKYRPLAERLRHNSDTAGRNFSPRLWDNLRLKMCTAGELARGLVWTRRSKLPGCGLQINRSFLLGIKSIIYEMSSPEDFYNHQPRYETQDLFRNFMLFSQFCWDEWKVVIELIFTQLISMKKFEKLKMVGVVSKNNEPNLQQF